MPGPANSKTRKKRQSKKEKNARKKEIQVNIVLPTVPIELDKVHIPLSSVQSPLETLNILRGESRASVKQTPNDSIRVEESENTINSDDVVLEEPIEDAGWETDEYERVAQNYQQQVYEDNPLEPEFPYIYDPGNGARVRDFLAFLKSPFAAPQTVEFDALGSDGRDMDDVDLSAARVIPMLSRILPGEFAAVLWYNRTRTTHRVCPACRRVYHLGESLKAHVDGLDTDVSKHHTNQHTLAEQYLSGTCSVPCFALSTYNYGPAAVLSYGLAWHQLDVGTRELLEGAGAGIDDQGLSLYIRISRCDGAGLRELLDGL